jgi:hypothetical protein
MPWPLSPEPKTHPNTAQKPDIDENIGRKRFGDFNVAGKVFVVTGGAQGLGLTMAEGLVEAGGKGNTSPSATHLSNALVLFTDNLLSPASSLCPRPRP